MSKKRDNSFWKTDAGKAKLQSMMAANKGGKKPFKKGNKRAAKADEEEEEDDRDEVPNQPVELFAEDGKGLLSNGPPKAAPPAAANKKKKRPKVKHNLPNTGEGDEDIELEFGSDDTVPGVLRFHEDGIESDYEELQKEIQDANHQYPIGALADESAPPVVGSTKLPNIIPEAEHAPLEPTNTKKDGNKKKKKDRKAKKDEYSSPIGYNTKLLENHKKFTVEGIEVVLPIEPYQEQLKYMSGIIRALSQGENALLESPTGTGKSISLLSATLAWLKAHREATADTVPSPEKIRIVYSSRTHSQLNQVVNEMKTLCYQASMVLVGSRDHLCIHDKVRELPERWKRDNACKTECMNGGCTFRGKTGGLSNWLQQKALKNKKHKTLQMEQEALAPLLNPFGETGIQPAKSEPDKAAIKMEEFCDELIERKIIWDIEDISAIGYKNGMCPYYSSKKMMTKADIVFLPYNYLTNANICANYEDILKNAILIFDEAHNVERTAEEGTAFDLEFGDLQAVEGRASSMRFDKHRGGDRYPKKNKGMEFSKAHAGLVENCLGRLMDRFSAKQASLARSKDGATEQIIDFEDGIRFLFGDWVGKGELKVPMESPAKLTEEALEEYTASEKDSLGPHNLLTFIQSLFALLKKEFGIDKASDTVAYNIERIFQFFDFVAVLYDNYIRNRECENPTEKFGYHFRFSFVLPENTNKTLPKTTFRSLPIKFDMSYKERDNMKLVQQIGEYLHSACKIVPGGILVFFTSYGALTRYLNHWRTVFLSGTGKNIYDAIGEQKVICVEDRQGIKQRIALDRFMSNYKKGAIFMGVCEGKLSEGINFKDDMARLVIIVGIPYASIRDQRIKTKMEYLNQIKEKQFEEDAISGGDWYEQNAIRALNQSVGRIIRHINDYGAILVLDSRFIERPYLLKKISNWISKKLKIVDTLDDVTDGLKRFFDGVKKCLQEQGGFWADHRERELAKARQELELGYNENEEDLEEIRQRLNLGLGIGPGIDGEGDEYDEPPQIDIAPNDLEMGDVDNELDDLVPPSQLSSHYASEPVSSKTQQDGISNLSTAVSNQKHLPNPFRLPEPPKRVEVANLYPANQPNQTTKVQNEFVDGILDDLCKEMEVDPQALDAEPEEPDPFGDELGDILSKPIVENKSLYQRILLDSEIEIGAKPPPKQVIMPPPPKPESFFDRIPKLGASATAALSPSANAKPAGDKVGTVTIIDQSKALEKPLAKVKQSGPSSLLNPNAIVMTQMPKFKSPVVGKGSPKQPLKNLPLNVPKFGGKPEVGVSSGDGGRGRPVAGKPEVVVSAVQQKAAQWNYPQGPLPVSLKDEVLQELDDLILSEADTQLQSRPSSLFDSSLFGAKVPAGTGASQALDERIRTKFQQAGAEKPSAGGLFQSTSKSAARGPANAPERVASSTAQGYQSKLTGAHKELLNKEGSSSEEGNSDDELDSRSDEGDKTGRQLTEDQKKYVANCSKSKLVGLSMQGGFGRAGDLPATQAAPPQPAAPPKFGDSLFGKQLGSPPPPLSGLFSGGARSGFTPMNVRKEELRKAAEGGKKGKGKF